MQNITLGEMQSIELNILLCLDALCKKHNLRYYIDGGTLLGAMCYEGFIPWDDDIDVKMPRPDYDRLADLAGELPEHIAFLRPEDDGYSYAFSKLIDNRTLLIECPGTSREHRGGVYVDILPMDGHPSNPLTMRRLERYKVLFHASKAGFGASLKGRLYRKLYTPESVYRRMTALARKTSYDTSEYVGLLIDGNAGKERFTRDSLEHPVLLPFEGHFFPASADYKEHLRIFYGDHVLSKDCYHNLPQYPSQHRYQVYRKEEPIV